MTQTATIELKQAPRSLQGRFGGGELSESWADQARASIKAARWLKKAQLAACLFFGASLSFGARWLSLRWAIVFLAFLGFVALYFALRTYLLGVYADALRKRIADGVKIVEEPDGKAA